jgi:alkylated DNA repair dioxygenase AlkB
MITGVTIKDSFVEVPQDLYTFLQRTVNWDERMVARMTASYGKAYNYSQMEYPFQPMLPELEYLTHRIAEEISFVPNNCLINFYIDGKSKMGFHSDQTNILDAGTGIAIVSLGETRTLKFRSIGDPSQTESYELPSGSLIYMTQEVQSLWQHAVPKTDTENGRMSLTFRRLK